jgi:hypothetical protein
VELPGFVVSKLVDSNRFESHFQESHPDRIQPHQHSHYEMSPLLHMLLHRVEKDNKTQV